MSERRSSSEFPPSGWAVGGAKPSISSSSAPTTSLNKGVNQVVNEGVRQGALGVLLRV